MTDQFMDAGDQLALELLDLIGIPRPKLLTKMTMTFASCRLDVALEFVVRANRKEGNHTILAEKRRQSYTVTEGAEQQIDWSDEEKRRRIESIERIDHDEPAPAG